MLPSSAVGQGTRLEEGFRALCSEVVFLCPRWPGEVAACLGAVVKRSLGDYTPRGKAVSQEFGEGQCLSAALLPPCALRLGCSITQGRVVA